jgi:hypothetical protein
MMNDRYAETEHDFAINVKDVQLPGRLTVPTNAEAIIIFTDSDSRSDAQSVQLAEVFQNKHYGTLQMDLLMEGEEDGSDMVNTLAERIETALNWLKDDADTRLCDYVLFSRTPAGAGSAIKVMQDQSRRIVSGIFHVDLVNPEELPEIAVPTLVLTGTIPDIEKKNLSMAKPDNVVQQVIDWYLETRDLPREESE